MKTKKQLPGSRQPGSHPAALQEQSSHGRIFSAPGQDKYLDPVQMQQLEQSFRAWAQGAARADVRASRHRILLIFLLIRYTGAKLNEVLRLDPERDIDFDQQAVRLSRTREKAGHAERIVQLPAALCREIRTIIADLRLNAAAPPLLNMDPGFVRRKFYERAAACAIAKLLGAPEILRRSRAIELMQNNMPLPAVQMLLGHSTPNLTSAYGTFSEDDIRQVTRMFMERESARKTSARNSFFGKIQTIQQGDIQARVELLTMGGHRVSTIITNDSLQRLGLKAGKLITAEIKAPWVLLHKYAPDLACSADNRLEGMIERINEGGITTEYIVRISDGTEVCAIVTRESGRRLAFAIGDRVWTLFNCFAVVLLAQ